MTIRRGSAIAAVLLLVACGGAREGARAYREGRYQEALDAYVVADRELGPAASAELLHNQAFAALRAGRSRQAEAAAEKAAVRGGVEFYPVRDFLLGNAAFARSERSEAAAGLQDAEPMAWQSAIDETNTAIGLWQNASFARPEWSAARRNIERAVARVRMLEQRKAEAEDRQKRDPKQPEPPPPDDPPDAGEPDPVGPAPELQSGELSAEQVANLFERLAAKERAKLVERAKQQRARSAAAERDW